MLYVGAADVETLTAGTDATVTVADGKTDITTLTAGNDAKVNVTKGDVSVDTLNTGNNLNMQVQNGDTTLQAVNAGGNISVQNGSSQINVTEMSAGGNISIANADRDIVYGKISAIDGILDIYAGKSSIFGQNLNNLLQAETVNLSAGTDIGQADNVLNTKAEMLNASAAEDIYLNHSSLPYSANTNFGNIVSQNGNVKLTAKDGDTLLKGNIQARKGDVNLQSSGSVIDEQQNPDGTIQANTVALTSENGEIGSADRYVQVDSSYTNDGYIDASANGGIFINETKGDMNVRRFVSKNGDINMSIDAGIQGVPLNEGEYHFEANNISLESRKGSIGSRGNELRLKVNDDIAGRINLKAKQNVAFRKTTPTLWSDYLIAENGSVTAILPASNAYVYNMQAPLGADIQFSDVGQISNLRVHYVDIENTTTSIPAVVNPAAVRKASEILYRQIDKQISFVDRNGITQLRKDWIKKVLPQKVLKEDYPDKISLNEKLKNRKNKQENI